MSEEVKVADLSEEDFDKEFETLMNTPNESEIEEEPVTEEVAEDEDEEPVEQQQDEEESEEEVNQESEEDEESDEDIEVEEPEEADETVVPDDSTNEDVQAFSFEGLPMDEVLPFEVKASGSKMKVTMNELVNGFEKGINYTQKLQGVAELRKTGNLMSENGLSIDDLNLLIEAKGGNKQALSKLVGDSGVDSLDLDADDAKGYTPNNYAKEPVSMELESIADEINRDTEYLPKVQSALETMPQEFYDEIAGNAGNLKALYSDVKAGSYDEIMPEMRKMVTLNGDKPSIELYKKAANVVASRRAPVKEVVAPNPVVEAKRNEKRNSAASGTKRKSPTPAKTVNFDDLDDSDFEKEFQKMTGRAISDYS